MTMPDEITLDEFIAINREMFEGAPRRPYPPMRNAFVREPGFSELYVRMTSRYLDGRLYSPVLDIARVEVQHRGQGTFTRLVERLRKTYPAMTLYVECVLEERFRRGLERAGFHDIPDLPGTYWK
jgi:hypothetical protein